MRKATLRVFSTVCVAAAGTILLSSSLLAQEQAGQGAPLVLERQGRVIALEPYAPNVLRITMSADKAGATGAPGYGIVATPSAEGWTHERASDGSDVYRSAQMAVRIAPEDLAADKLPQAMTLDDVNRQLREHISVENRGVVRTTMRC